MKERCLNPNNPNYKYYGAKDITVCKEWLDDFMNFYNWSIENGYRENLTIDRIDNDKGYSPSNCRWTTYKEQVENRKTLYSNIKYNNEIHTLSEWSKLLNIPYSTLRYRYSKYKEILLRRY